MGTCQRTEQNQENSFVKYFKENYKVKNIHKVECVGICYIYHIGMRLLKR